MKRQPIIVLMLLVLLSGMSFPTVYYLDKDNPNSSDSNIGNDPNQPWLTWNKAVNTAIAGDVVIIRKSSAPYIPTGHTNFHNSGTATNRIKFVGENSSDRPIIDYQNNKNFSANNIQYVTWEALEIRNTGNGLWTEGSDHLVFRSIFINGCSSGSTLRFQGDYNLVEYCEITGSGWNGVTIMSHSKNTPTPTDDWRCRGNIVRYNYIHDNSAHHSINIFPYVSPGGSDLMPQYIDSTEIYGNRLENSNWGIYSRYMRYFKIYNNLIINCTEGGIQLERNYDSGNSGSPDSSRYGTYNAGGLIANNTIYNSKGTYGCAIDNRACNNVKFYNNAIWNSASSSDGVQWRFYNPTASSAPAPFNVNPVSNLTIDHNMTSNDGGSVLWDGGSSISVSSWNTNYCTNGIIATPQIETGGTDSDWDISGSYLPSAGGNVVDAGVDVFGITTDYHGGTRLSNSWDIGAVELGGGVDISPPQLLISTVINPNLIELTFSESIQQSSAQNQNNYSINNGILVNSATLVSSTKVRLQTSQHQPNINYSVIASNILDLAGNLISTTGNSVQYSYLPDTNAPEVLSAELIDSVTLKISFSEPLDLATSQINNNYLITGNVTIFSASLSGSDVILITSPHSPGNYIVSVSNVTDLAGNTISLFSNSAQYEFVPGLQTELTQLTIIDATASVIPEPEHSPEKSIDGMGFDDADPDSRWAGDTMPEWIMFDLGIAKDVSLVKLSFYNWNNGRIYYYSVSVSSNMNQWMEVLPNATSSPTEWTVNEFQPTEARYVKITFLGSNENGWAGLWEGELWSNNALSVDDENINPDGFYLQQNYPNPFNPSTTINYSLATSQKVTLSIYNILGQLVDEVVNGVQSAGEHKIVFNAEDLASGIYIYQLQTESGASIKKMILQK